MTSENDRLTRRTFLAGAGALAAASLIPPAWSATGAPASPLGEWLDDDSGLPCYRYTGPMRFPDSPQRDGDPMLPDDPFFLLGNYRLTLFTHASGIVQILTGERAWGRMNQGDARWSGSNEAAVEFAGEKHNLIAIDSPAAAAATKRFGVGFARYDYTLAPGLEVTRLLSVAPSTKAGEGVSAFLTQVRLRNAGSSPIQLRYSESVRARYQQLFAQWDDFQHDVSWTPQPAQQSSPDTVQVSFTARGRRLLTFAPPGEMTRFEQFPPALFVKAIRGNAAPLAAGDAAGHPCIGISAALILQPGEEHEIAFITGYARDASTIDNLCASLTTAPTPHDELGSAFAGAWRSAIPAFTDEPDAALRREMRWNAAALEAMVTWREYYDETVIPQGTMYDYIWGEMASSRDLAQQALPFCHTNPAIARSTLRFIMKRMLPDGEIKLNDQGFGWSPSGAQQTSDQQLYFFLLLAEYLRVTRDASVLQQQIGYYPLENSGHDTGLAHVRQAFLFLRDRVGVGAHGIVRRWNSDWNDMFGWWQSPIPYNTEFQVGESHMNSAMAIAILGDLAAAVDALHNPAATELTAAMREYRSQLHDAFTRDLGDRAFPRRAWVDYKTPLGEDNMWLEPQGYTLLIPEFDVARKRRLFTELQLRLLSHEALGARQIESPTPQSATPAGSRENGGFWYALNGPLILGVATFDRHAAQDLLRRMTFTNYAKNFPDYWTGQWSASDSLDSSLLKTSGLSIAIPWCAHAHAWPLYCYLRLRSAGEAAA
jgi:cellobiose phosphorylase